MALDPTTGGRKRSKSLRAVQGENASEKARTPVVQAARETSDLISTGKLRPKALPATLARLTPAEKRDVDSYSRVKSNQVQDAAFGKLKHDTGTFLDEAIGALINVKPSTAYDSYRHPIKRLQHDPTPEETASSGVIPGFGFGKAAKAAEAVEKVRPAGADEIMDVLPKAKRLRRKQEAGYGVERSQRAARVEEAMKVGGEEGYQAALRELKGELPKLRLGDELRDFDQASADELFTHIQQLDGFRPYEKVTTQRALQRVLQGTVPTRSEIKLLERAFGPDLADQLSKSVSFWRHAANVGLSVINIPRSLMASLDLSAPFRQGLVLGARHPIMFGKAFAPMLKSFASEKAYLNVMDEIASRPSFKKMEQARLQLTDFENLSTREEAFQSNLAETLTGGKRSPVRMSGRAYTAFLNKFRADAFDHYLKMLEDDHRTLLGFKREGLDLGDDVESLKAIRSVASWVNHATGRGSAKALEGAMVPLSAALFSPRLILSRLQLLNPVYYASLDPFARKQAVRGASQLLGAISLTLYLAKLNGAEVSMDPRNSDFGKIKIGDTRVDIAGGFQQYIVNAYRVIKGETVSSTTGEVTSLEGGFAKPSRADILMGFGEGKLAPVPAFATDWAKNENFAGEPFDLKREGSKLFLPIGGVSAVEAYRQGGIKPAAVSAGLGGVGFGVLTYPDKEPDGSGKSLRGSSGGRKKSLRSGGGKRRKSLRSH